MRVAEHVRVDERQMLAQLLQNAGYDTAAVLPDRYFSPRRWRGITRGFARVDESSFATLPALPHNGAKVTDAAIEELARARTRPRSVGYEITQA